MKAVRSSNTHSQQRGVGLIEVLIALVIFALGVVGMAGLQMRTIALTMDSTQRSYAVSKSQDIADRIRSTSIAPSEYLGSYNADGNYCDATPASCADTVGSSVAPQCTEAQMVLFDLHDTFCVGHGSLEDQVADWQVDITCEFPNAGVITDTTLCEEPGATVVVTTTWFARSAIPGDNTAATGVAATTSTTSATGGGGATTAAAGGAATSDDLRDSMTLRFVP